MPILAEPIISNRRFTGNTLSNTSGNKLENIPGHGEFQIVNIEMRFNELLNELSYTKDLKRTFTDKYKEAISSLNNVPTQHDLMMDTIDIICQKVLFNIEALNIDYSLDDEIVIYNQKGNIIHYLIICDNNEMFFGEANKGDKTYLTKKLGRDFRNVEELVTFFLSNNG